MQNSKQDKIFWLGILTEINNAILPVTVFAVILCLIAAIVLIAGGSLRQLVLIEVSVIAAFGLISAANSATKSANNKIKKAQETLLLPEPVETCQPEVAEPYTRPSYMPLELDEDKNYWNNLTLGGATRDTMIYGFLRKNEKIINEFYAGNSWHSMQALVRYCECAIEFYEWRKIDVRDVRVIDFSQRLADDGYYLSFCRAWEVKHSKMIADTTALNTLLMVHSLSDFDFQGMVPLGRGGGDDWVTTINNCDQSN